MVKHLKTQKQKANPSNPVNEVPLDIDKESPVIQINSETVVSNDVNDIENQVNVVRGKQWVNQRKSVGTDSSCTDSNSSNSSLNNSNRSDRKNSKEQNKLKNKLGEEGQKHVAELIAYLHSDKPLIKNRVDLDDEELELLLSLEKPVDLDKFFEPKIKKIKEKLWITPIVFQKNENKNSNESAISQKGFGFVNRFGEGVDDGCNVSLSLSTKSRNFDDIFKKPLEWNDIIEEADEALFKYENSGKQKSRMARRGSLLQPRFLFLSPHPEVGYERVLQSANCIPLREWTSELFLDSKESSELLDSETKRNLKWNASVEDFRHLMSPELRHFGNDIYSMIVEARRRQSLIPPSTESQPMRFRRKSFDGGQVWAPMQPNTHKKNDYKHKLQVIQKMSTSQRINNSQESQNKSYESNGLLVIPSEATFLFKKKERIIKHQIESSEESITFKSLNDINAKVMANEFTLIAKELFLSIKNTEVITLLIRPHSVNPVTTCPNIIALLGFQKRIIRLIASYILDESTAESCAQRMAFFIEIAEELKELRNWYSVYSIILSLQSPPIARLRQSWQIISNEYSDLYCEFIELSEMIKRENNSPLDYTPPFIPLFTDLMDDLKERCGSKYYSIKTHRLNKNWSEPSTLANWVEDEIVDLVNVAQDRRKILRRVERINKDSHKEHNKKGINRIFNFGKSRDSPSASFSSGSTSRTNSIQSRDTSRDTISNDRESKQSFSSDSKLIKAKLSSRNFGDNANNSKMPSPSCKNIWSVADMQKLNEDEEKEILQEIARGLVCYQKYLMSYYLEVHHEEARNFLLLQSCEEMDVCMKRSLVLEKSNKKTNISPNISIEDDLTILNYIDDG